MEDGRPGPYLDLLLQRSDALLAGSRTRLDRTADALARLGLPWHAEQTRELAASVRA